MSRANSGGVFSFVRKIIAKIDNGRGGGVAGPPRYKGKGEIYPLKYETEEWTDLRIVNKSFNYGSPIYGGAILQHVRTEGEKREGWFFAQNATAGGFISNPVHLFVRYIFEKTGGSNSLFRKIISQSNKVNNLSGNLTGKRKTINQSLKTTSRSKSLRGEKHLAGPDFINSGSGPAGEIVFYVAPGGSVFTMPTPLNRAEQLPAYGEASRFENVSEEKAFFTQITTSPFKPERPEFAGQSVLPAGKMPVVWREYLPVMRMAGESSFWKIAGRVSLIHNAHQETIMKRRNVRLAALKLLQNNNRFILTNQTISWDRYGGILEMSIPASLFMVWDHPLGYMMTMPSMIHKIEEQDPGKLSPLRETALKYRNISPVSPRRTIDSKTGEGKSEGRFSSPNTPAGRLISNAFPTFIRYILERTGGNNSVLRKIIDRSNEVINFSTRVNGQSKLIIALSLNKTGRPKGFRGEKPMAGPDLLRSGSGSVGEIVYYEAPGGSAPSISTQVSRQDLGRRDKEASGRARSVSRQAYQILGGKLVENVLRIAENRLARYLAAKERFESAIDKNPFFTIENTDSLGGTAFFKQGEAQESLTQSYAGFKAELVHIINPFEPGRPETSGESALRAGKMPAVGMEHLPAVRITGSTGFWKTAGKVFSRLLAGRKLMEKNKRGYSRFLEREKEIQPRGVQTALVNNTLTHNPSQDAIMKRRETRQAALDFRQSNSQVVLSNKINFQDRWGGPLEMLIPARPSTAQDYTSGYAGNMPPITHKSEEPVSGKQSPPRETVVKSLNTPLDSRPKTIKPSVSGVDLLSPTELSNLVDKVYSQLETRLARERRRFGY